MSPLVIFLSFSLYFFLLYTTLPLSLSLSPSLSLSILFFPSLFPLSRFLFLLSNFLFSIAFTLSRSLFLSFHLYQFPLHFLSSFTHFFIKLFLFLSFYKNNYFPTPSLSLSFCISTSFTFYLKQHYSLSNFPLSFFLSFFLSIKIILFLVPSLSLSLYIYIYILKPLISFSANIRIQRLFVLHRK